MTAKSKKLDKSFPAIGLVTRYEVWWKDGHGKWHSNSGHESLSDAKSQCNVFKMRGTVHGVVANTAIVKAERTRLA